MLLKCQKYVSLGFRPCGTFSALNSTPVTHKSQAKSAQGRKTSESTEGYRSTSTSNRYMKFPVCIVTFSFIRCNVVQLVYTNFIFLEHKSNSWNTLSVYETKICYLKHNMVSNCFIPDKGLHLSFCAFYKTATSLLWQGREMRPDHCLRWYILMMAGNQALQGT